MMHIATRVIWLGHANWPNHIKILIYCYTTSRACGTTLMVG